MMNLRSMVVGLESDVANSFIRCWEHDETATSMMLRSGMIL
jgi:hypothetical protein